MNSGIKKLLALSVIGVALTATGCASTAGMSERGAVQRLAPEELARLTPPPNPKVSLAEIVTLSKEGGSADAIIKKIDETGTIHNLTAAQIVDLSKQGVDQKVIDHMALVQERARQATLTTQLADRDREARDRLERERAARRNLERRYDPFFHSPTFGPAFGPFSPRPFYGWNYRSGWNWGFGGGHGWRRW
jgi:hypothetical protein